MKPPEWLQQLLLTIKWASLMRIAYANEDFKEIQKPFDEHIIKEP